MITVCCSAVFLLKMWRLLYIWNACCIVAAHCLHWDLADGCITHWFIAGLERLYSFCCMMKSRWTSVFCFLFFFKKHRSVWNLEMVGVAAVFQLQNSWIILWEEIMLNLTSCATTVLGLSCCCGMKLEVKQVNEVCSLSSTILSLWISLCNFIQSCEVLRAKILCNGAISSYRQLALSHLNDLDFQES